MIKKLILVFIASMLFLTGCQTINNVDFNKMVMNSSKITSSESKVTTSIDLSYNRANVQDRDLLKVLDLLNHAKLEIQANLKNSSTASLSGNVILQQGNIPFQLYVDQKEMVLLLDHAIKPIKIPVTENNSTDTKLIQDIQTKLLEPTVKNLPNPKHLSVGLKTEKVHGTSISGYSVHAEMDASEVPQLLTAFMDNLLKDTTSVSQMVTAINELNKTTGDSEDITADEFKSGLQEFKTELNQMLPELQKMNLLSTKNYFKTDLFVDKNLFERKSSSDLNIASIPAELGLDVIGVRLKMDSETWNINGPVNAGKINYSSFLDENASEEQFLATLDKRTSVLYSIMASYIYPASQPLAASQVLIVNSYNNADTITVKGLAKGDVVKVYKANTGGDLWATSQVTGPTVSMSINQLGKNAGKVYISVIRANNAESNRVEVGYGKEVIPQSKALTFSQIEIKNYKNLADTVTVKGIEKGDVIKVYKAKTGGALWTTTKAAGSTSAMSIRELGKNPGKVYISITRANSLESNRVEVGYGKEVIPQSKALIISQVTIKNNKNIADTVTVKGIAKGDVIKVYKAKTGGALWTSTKAAGSTATMSIRQLGKNPGKVYVSIIRANSSESSRLEVGFGKEMIYPSNALTVSQVVIKNNKTKADTVTVNGIAKGDVIKVYKAKTGATLWTSAKAGGSTTTMSVRQLGKSAGRVYISIIHPNMAESSRLEIGFPKE